MLMREGIDFEVITDVPEPGKWSVMLLSSVACMSQADGERMTAYLEAGGVVIATGQLGTRDADGIEGETAWLERFGFSVTVEEPVRVGGFPPFDAAGPDVARCSGAYDGAPLAEDAFSEVGVGEGVLVWSPGRIGKQNSMSCARDYVGSHGRATLSCAVTPPPGWYVRRFVDGERVLLHGIPKQVDTVSNPSLRNQFIDEAIVEKIEYPASPLGLSVRPARTPEAIFVHSPDLAASRHVALGDTSAGTDIPIDLTGIKRFFSVEIVFADHDVPGDKASKRSDGQS